MTCAAQFVRYVTAVSPAIAALFAAVIAFFVRVRAIRRRTPVSSSAVVGSATPNEPARIWLRNVRFVRIERVLPARLVDD